MMQISFGVLELILRNLISFSLDFNKSSTRKKDLQMPVLKSKEEMIKNV